MSIEHYSSETILLYYMYYTDIRRKVVSYCIHCVSFCISFCYWISVIGLQVLEVDIFEVEEKINYGFTELAVKLSEISFRPIFLKVGS